MKCNVGGWDRNIRLVSGAGLLTAGLLGLVKGRARSAALALGTTQLLTGLSRYCPVNQALGINTCSWKTRLARKAVELVL